MSDSESPNSWVRCSLVVAGRTGLIGLFDCRRGGGGGVAINAASFFAWLPEERCTSVPTRSGRESGRTVVPGSRGLLGGDGLSTFAATRAVG